MILDSKSSASKIYIENQIFKTFNWFLFQIHIEGRDKHKLNIFQSTYYIIHAI